MCTSSDTKARAGSEVVEPAEDRAAIDADTEFFGKLAQRGVIEVKDRRTGERREVAVDAAVQEILAEIGQA